jgi:Arc/MetJ family transcription regulator
MQIACSYHLHREADSLRTRLNLDDHALAAAQKASPGKETALINEALRDYARRKKLRGLLAFEGKVEWQGDLDSLRKRTRRGGEGSSITRP